MLHLEPSLKNKVLPSIYLTITGGGTGIIPRLLEQGGASSYFVGAEVPYSTNLSETLIHNFFPNIQNDHRLRIKLCSKEMAKLLAYHSETFLFRLGELPNHIAIGVTASLMKTEGERPERTNEAYACFNLSGKLFEYHWVLPKTYTVENAYCYPPVWEESASRAMQENELVRLLYNTLVEILSE